MQDRHTLATLIGAFSFAVAMHLIPADTAIPVAWVRVIAWAAFAALLAWTVFDLWGWRLRPILRTWIERPDLHGTWRATIRSNWTDPTTGKRLDAIEAYMVIRQSYRSIRLQLMTAESVSEVLEASVLRAGNDRYRIAAIYRSSPTRAPRSDEQHVGTLMLDVPGKRPKILLGHYATDRRTEGTIELRGRTRRLLRSFREASDTFARRDRRAKKSTPRRPDHTVPQRQAA